MRRSALLGPLLLLGGCSGLGHFFSDTARLPGQNPNATTGVSENLQRSRGVEPSTDPIRPQDGNVWPGPPQPLPTLSDVSHFGNPGDGGALLGGTGGTGGTGSTGGAMPRGGSMSMGEGESVRRGAAVDDGGFAGGGGNGMGSALSGGGLSASVPDPAARFHGGNGGGGSGSAGGGAHGGGGDGGGNIVIPNGDGTSTVISPDGSVKTVKGTPK